MPSFRHRTSPGDHHALAGGHDPRHRALRFRIGRSVRPRVVHEGMHRAAQHLLRRRSPASAKAAVLTKVARPSPSTPHIPWAVDSRSAVFSFRSRSVCSRSLTRRRAAETRSPSACACRTSSGPNGSCARGPQDHQRAQDLRPAQERHHQAGAAVAASLEIGRHRLADRARPPSPPWPRPTAGSRR